jgi:hypothetical protein
MSFGHIVRRLFLYFGLALAALAIFSLIFALSVRTHIVIPFRWVMLTLFTGLLLYTMIKTDRTLWAVPGFWLLCFGFLGIHLAVFISVLRIYPDFRPVWYVPVVVAEAGVFGAFVGLLPYRPTRRAKPKR